MNNLLQDGFRRRLVQVLIALLFALICLPSLLLLLLLAIQRTLGLQGWVAEAGSFLVHALSFPLLDATSQLSTVIVATLPASSPWSASRLKRSTASRPPRPAPTGWERPC